VFLKAWNEMGEGNYVEPDQNGGEHGLKLFAMKSQNLQTLKIKCAGLTVSISVKSFRLTASNNFQLLSSIQRRSGTAQSALTESIPS